MKRIAFLFTVFIGCVVMISGCGKTSDILSEDEIKMFNSDFFNGGTYNMNNMMLSSEYDQAENIDLFQLFYNGIDGITDQVSEEEKALLQELNSEASYLDIAKVTKDEMNAFLEEKLGIRLDETQKNGLEKFYYLDQYDSFLSGIQILTGALLHPASGNLIMNLYWNIQKNMETDSGMLF